MRWLTGHYFHSQVISSMDRPDRNLPFNPFVKKSFLLLSSMEVIDIDRGPPSTAEDRGIKEQDTSPELPKPMEIES